jgi:hypothetical protein
MTHFEGHFEGAKTFLTPQIVPSAARDNLGVKKSFLNRGTLVILCTRVLLCTVVVCCCLLLGVLVCCCVLLCARAVRRSPCSCVV